MLAQRQRELYSIQHRQRQLIQQKVMLMRQNIAGAPAKGPPTASQQQFSLTPGYSPVTGNPPTSPTFSPAAGGPLDAKLSVRAPLNNQTLLGAGQSQFDSAANSSLQTGLFQTFGASGKRVELEAKREGPCPHPRPCGVHRAGMWSYTF